MLSPGRLRPQAALYVCKWHRGQHRASLTDWSIMICGWMDAWRTSPDALNSSSPFSHCPGSVTFPQVSMLHSHSYSQSSLPPSPPQGCSLQTPSTHISTSLSYDEIFESESYFMFLSPKPVMVLDTCEVLNKDLLLSTLQRKKKELGETSLILSY